MNNKIGKNKYFVFTLLSILCVAGWFFNFKVWHINWLNFLFLFFYGWFNSAWLGRLLGRWGFEKELRFILAVFFLLYLIAFGMAIPIVLYKVGPIYLLGLLLFLTIVISLWSKKKSKVRLPTSALNMEEGKYSIKIPRVVYYLLFMVMAFALALLFQARTGQYIRSPWHEIHPLYLYGWLLISFILGLLVFSKCRLRTFLIIIILSSLLLHAYLLIPYQAGFGGDKWRHIGAEKWLMEGKIYTPALFGEEVSYKQLGPFKVPEVLVVGNKTSYANMWGLTIALSWLTGVDVYKIDLILGFLLFSIFLPFLVLKIGSFISKKKEFLYLLIFLPLLFFPFQIYGSITVPMAFAFLPFLFALIFLLRYFKEPTKLFSGWRLLLTLIFLILFLYFNYILYLILFIELLLLAILIKNIPRINLFRRQTGRTALIIGALLVCFALLVIFIPSLDTSNQFSWFKRGLNKTEIVSGLKDFPIRLLTSRAIFPRTYCFEQDNWLYAQVGEYLSRSEFLKVLSWPLILTPLIWLLVILGLLWCKKMTRPRIGWLFALMLIIVLANQMIATYFMGGNHIFSKRLIFFTSFLILVPLAWGIYWLIERTPRFIFSRGAIAFTLVLLLSLIGVTVYASGPKFQVVTRDELKAAEYVWQKIKSEPVQENYCVLANTWPLLALEGVSGRQIVTGGFPYYHEYRQPERVQLFSNMNMGPSIRYLEKSLEITGTKECYFMTEERWILFDRREQIISQLDEILGQHQEIGEVMVWLYQPNEIRSPDI